MLAGAGVTGILSHARVVFFVLCGFKLNLVFSALNLPPPSVGDC